MSEVLVFSQIQHRPGSLSACFATRMSAESITEYKRKLAAAYAAQEFVARRIKRRISIASDYIFNSTWCCANWAWVKNYKTHKV